MAKRTGPTNQDLSDLIQTLKKESIEKNVNIWKRIAFDLEKPTRKRRIVNLARLNRFTKDGEVVVVPGKLLGAGMIGHKVDVAAYSFSDSARQQIEKFKGKCISIRDLLKANPKGEKIRIIG
jgi:large subunit ribosomal protein L18e